ncbi:MAG TPA: GlsB/YeaQ/YmgE family stress response membrane protein [Candidatus Acidoferrales bacterium]|jgi:uncharacterized membrane protein YeaQ/YmgE (transglycosylase-associated protein family)|nr:GlsB/YeaQ/YmgE family stress response membrane protein [Candidatus Acidoferrales bacterium]
MILPASIVLRDDRVYLIGVSMHGFIGWIIIGLVAGWIAGHLSRGRGFGCLVDVILGLIGAVIGGWIFTRLGISMMGFWGSLAAATVGAILLVLIARLFAGSRD